jgi:malate permease and related proteins
VALLLPLFGFLCGLGLSSISFSKQLKQVLASLLSRCFIPFVIVYNMVFYQAGSLSLMIFSFVVAVFMYYFFRAVLKDKTRALCMSYLNLAWLGFPFALALFGEQISAPMVALYVGGSIFGNIWAITALSKDKQPFHLMLKKVAFSPPVFALIIAIILRLIGVQNLENHQLFDILNSIAKFGMTFSGMCVLGMWLRNTRIQFADLFRSSKLFLMKVTVGIVICSLTYFLIPIPHIEKYIGVMFLLFCLPPAANIVALETHYLGTGVSAKYIASGTIVSCMFVAVYGVFLHMILPLL